MTSTFGVPHFDPSAAHGIPWSNILETPVFPTFHVPSFMEGFHGREDSEAYGSKWVWLLKNMKRQAAVAGADFFCCNIGSEILGRPSLNIPRLFHSLQFNIARPHGTHRIGCASTDRNGCHIMIWWALSQFANVFSWALRLWRFFHKFLPIRGLEFKRMQWRHQNWTWNLTRCDIVTFRLPGPS